MAQAISRPFAAEARVRSQPRSCDICGGPSGTETVFFFQHFFFSPVTAIPPMLHNYLHLNTTLYQDKRTKSGNFPKSEALSDVGYHWTSCLGF